MIIIDTSVWFDLFSSDSERKEKAEELLRFLEEKRVPILEPFIFKIEFSALLSRQFKKDYVLKLVESVSLLFNRRFRTSNQANRGAVTNRVEIAL